MTLRAEPGQNPVLSVATDAELSAINTSFLVAGDYVWSDESGGYVYLPSSTATPVTNLVLATSNSDGATLPGRFVTTGVGPAGRYLQTFEDQFVADQSINSNILADALTVTVTTTAPQEQVDVGMSIAGHANAAQSILTAALAVDGVIETTSGGFTLTSTGAADWESGSLRKILTLAPGTHVISVQLAVADGANPFDIPASSQAPSSNGVLTAIRLGPSV